MKRGHVQDTDEFEENYHIGASPVKITSGKKRSKSNEYENCIICDEDNQIGLTFATKSGISSIIQACEQCKDTVYERFNTRYGDISIDNIELYYHRSCFQTYTSKSNIQHRKICKSLEETDFNSETIEEECDKKKTRSSNPIIWSNCLICGYKKHKGDTKLHVIQSYERGSDLLKAAQVLGDDDVLSRIIDEDLIAKEGQYHNKCMKQFLRKSNAKTEQDTDSSASSHTTAFNKLVKEIDHSLFQERRALWLQKLNVRYNELALESNECQSGSWALKANLIAYYKDKITVQSLKGQGNPNVILSSAITLADAVYAAQQLKDELHDCSNEDILSNCLADENFKENTLRNAAAILRNEVEQIQRDSSYPSPQEIGQSGSEDFIPPDLFRFILLLLDPNYFQSTKEPDEAIRRKAAVVAECILHSARNITTPFHLGLAVQLHHAHGSRQLIDTLHAYGLSVSYSELRQFLTSLADSELTKLDNGVYKPSGIIPVSNGGALIQEGDDNIDLNTETIDGKNTFHSMARVVFQMNSHQNTSSSRIPRCQKRSLSDTETFQHLMQVMPYQKPTKRPEPPRHENVMDIFESSMVKLSSNQDLTWVLLRMFHRGTLLQNLHLEAPSVENGQVIPFWSGYNKLRTEEQSTRTVVSYAPIVDAKPSDISTVYTTMKKCKEMSLSFGQSYSIQTMDLQLYAVAQNVKWNMTTEFNNHILRLGGFHEVQSFISAIGKLWGDGGLLDLLSDSGVYALSTAEQMLSGKQHHRAVRGLTLVYEVLQQSFLLSFFKWSQAEKHAVEMKALVTHIADCGSPDVKGNLEYIDNLNGIIKDQLEPLMKEFELWGSKSPTFSYWTTFLKAVQILLWNIRAERENDWKGHLATQGLMLPYMFAANRTNYARYIPVYIMDMMNLPDAVQQAFAEGQHTYREKPGTFNGLWTDMGVEKTVIRDSKSDGGIIGKTRRHAALFRWTITRHLMGEYSREMQGRSGVKNTSPLSHDEEKPTSLERDESHIKLMINHLSSCMTDPFDVESHPDVLINISTGAFATSDVQHGLTNIEDIGRKRMETFVKDTLSTDGEKSFYSPITRSGILTFSDRKKKTKVLTSDGKVRLVNLSPEMVFRRALSLTSCRSDITMDTVLSHTVGPVPSSIFNADSTMRKTVKADLARKLEETLKTVTPDPKPERREDTVYIRDAMALLQTMKPVPGATFDILGDTYIHGLLYGFRLADTVIDVFDRYDHPHSVKSSERSRRGNTSTAKEYHVSSGMQVPPWSKFLSLSSNKKKLNTYLCEKMVCKLPERLKHNQHVVIAGGFADGTETREVSNTGSASIPELCCSHEEADTRMLMHAMYSDSLFAKKGLNGNIIIKSPDTDVLVLCIHYFPKMKNVHQLWFETGVTTGNVDKHRFIPVHALVKNIPKSLCSALPAIHALTGCDTTSSFFRIGKKTVFNAVVKCEMLCNSASSIGNDNIDEAVKASRELVSHLYDPKGKYVHKDLNELRVKMSRANDVELAKLPPCENAFREHVKRVVWQTRIWTNSHEATPSLGIPEDYGWCRQDNELSPLLYKGPTASEVLDCLVCTCKRGQCSTKCTCKMNNLVCSELCFCHGEGTCTNSLHLSTDHDGDDGDNCEE